MRYFVGVDIGQSPHPSALAVLKRVEELRPKDSPPGTVAWEREPQLIVSKYQGVLLKDYPLGTKYNTVVQDCKKLMRNPELTRRSVLIVDATGVGKPVIEMMRLNRLAPIGITFTGGKSVNQHPLGYTVPKRDLVTTVQVLFQTGRIELPGKLPETDKLLDQLQRLTMLINKLGHDQYGLDQEEGDHYDLFFALALAAWFAERAFAAYRKDEERKPERDEFDPLRHGL